MKRYWHHSHLFFSPFLLLINPQKPTARSEVWRRACATLARDRRKSLKSTWNSSALCWDLEQKRGHHRNHSHGRRRLVLEEHETLHPLLQSCGPGRKSVANFLGNSAGESNGMNSLSQTSELRISKALKEKHWEWAKNSSPPAHNSIYW